jgi:hypothetical protein
MVRWKVTDRATLDNVVQSVWLNEAALTETEFREACKQKFELYDQRPRN